MPTRAKKICAHPQCGKTITAGAYCHDHMQAKGSASKSWMDTSDHQRKVYHSARWKALRKKILRASPCCIKCKEDGRIVAASHVDHIKAVKDGGAIWDEENLQSLCRSCHSSKTSQEIHARRAEQRRKRML